MDRIETARLVLRPAVAGDLEALHAILSDRAAMAFWSTPPHENLEQTREWLDGMMSIRAGEGEDFVVELDGAVIGKAGLYAFPEIGFIFHPRVWGRGLAAEALGAVLDRAFHLHRLDHVEADVDPRNAASLRLLGRLSFTEVRRAERTWLVGADWCDSVYLRIGAADWRRGGEPGRDSEA